MPTSYGSQWHPEKPQFEWWSSEVINHSPASIQANSYFARFFATEARRNSHAFANPTAAAKSVIYNFQAQFTGAHGVPGFEQCYFFP